MKRTLTILAIAVALTGTAFAQKSPGLAPGSLARKSGVKGSSTINSSLKSRGFIGPFEIIAHRERGLFGPSTVETFVYNTETGSLVVINPSSSPGVGIAAVNGGALVGASYLFGSSRRPDQNQITAGSSSTATASGSGSSTSTGGTGSTHNNNNNNDHSHNGH